MNPSPQSSRTELIQRLADGELSEPERKELLQRIDDETPERWRDVALCLMGNRLLAEGLRDAVQAPAVAAVTPAANVIAFPMWKRIGALAAALAVGLGLGFVAPRQRDAGEKVTIFANLDEFKMAVGEAVEDSDLGDGLQSLLAANELQDGGDRPTKPADGGPRPFAPEPGDAPTPHGSPDPEEIESKVDQIQKNVADLRRLLQSAQDRK